MRESLRSAAQGLSGPLARRLGAAIAALLRPFRCRLLGCVLTAAVLLCCAQADEAGEDQLPELLHLMVDDVAFLPHSQRTIPISIVLPGEDAFHITAVSTSCSCTSIGYAQKIILPTRRQQWR